MITSEIEDGLRELIAADGDNDTDRTWSRLCDHWERTGRVGTLYNFESALVDYVEENPDAVTDSDLSRTIRALVRLESMVANCGSASQVYRLIQVLKSRDPVLGEEICNWALYNSANHYIPYGTISKRRYLYRTCREYEEAAAMREAAHNALRAKLESAARERRDQRARSHRARLEEQWRQREERRQVLLFFEGLSSADRLCIIADDTEHVPYWYPSDWALVDTDVLKALPGATTERLLQRLSAPPRGPWKRLGLLLREMN
jgi:hypothetical protein